MLTSAGLAEAAEVRLTAPSVAAGEAFDIDANLIGSGGTSAVSVDLELDPSSVNGDFDCQVDDSIGMNTPSDKMVVLSDAPGGRVRIGVVGLNATPIPSGPLFRCRFISSPFADPGDYPITAKAGGASSNGSSASITAASSELSLAPAVASDGDADGIVFTPGRATCAGGNTANCSDNCPGRDNASQADNDQDGAGDSCDLCQGLPSADSMGRQLDVDVDGFGNPCDCDFDNDGDCDSADFDTFADEFAEGVDSGAGTDMDGDGEVGMQDFTLFLSGLAAGEPGPSAVVSP